MSVRATSRQSLKDNDFTMEDSSTQITELYNVNSKRSVKRKGCNSKRSVKRQTARQDRHGLLVCRASTMRVVFR
jgi:hypothetical protein